MISGQNNGKTHTKQMEKGWEWDFSTALSSTQQHSATLSSTQQHSAALSSTQQHSAVLNLQPISRFSWLFASSGWKKKNNRKHNAKSIKNWGKTLGMLLKCSVFDQNPSKTMAKTKKTSAKQMEKGWGLHFSAMLNLQHISEFFLTFCRVRAEKGENEAKK